MSTGGGSNEDDDLDENKLDFMLLKSRQSSPASDKQTEARTSTAFETHKDDKDGKNSINSPSTSTHSYNDMIWPLYLSPLFINHFIIGDVIGNGSYAEVRECVDTKTLERHAMKIINKSHLNKQNSRALSNQLREIKLLRHLRHPNLIRMKECFQNKERIYIILEYCSYNLDELLNDQVGGKFHISLGRHFFHQLCLAVCYLHSVGIIHRDIKPQNMLLSNCGSLKLIDFGVSHTLSMWSSSDLCVNYEGSPLFQAPEVVSGQKEYNGFKVDVWSCGVTLYLMLFGVYPFIDDALLGLYDKILAQDLTVPKDSEFYSPVLSDLLVMMLDKNSSLRANIEQVLIHPWLKLVGAPSDELENSEFFDLVTKKRDDKQKDLPLYASSKHTDMYKSMTVLPYLYRHHFPDLPIRKSRRSSNSNVSNSIIEKINSFSTNSRDTSPFTISSSTAEPVSKSGSTPSTPQKSPESSPHDIVDDKNENVEWGTKEQYNLLKVPRIRANRIRCGISSSTNERRRKRKHKRGNKKNRKYD